MSSGRNDRVVVVLGASTPEIDETLRALALAPLVQGSERATVWLPAEKIESQPAPLQEEGAPEPSPNPLLITIGEAANSLGVGRSTVYELIASGELDVIHIGRAARIRTSALHELVDRLHQRHQGGVPIQSLPSAKVRRAGHAGSSQR
ncbi:MAG TPA: helix-turn-helix domain-containing protein [Acidimicrobiales bacterium]|nr:helix-turn-helix domain-containing protein [Acidimicrobiales bacterium]